MSISSEIQRIKAAKEAIKQALIKKGLTVSGSLDSYAGLIEIISSSNSSIDTSVIGNVLIISGIPDNDFYQISSDMNGEYTIINPSVEDIAKIWRRESSSGKSYELRFKGTWVLWDISNNSDTIYQSNGSRDGLPYNSDNTSFIWVAGPSENPNIQIIPKQ